MRGLLVLVLCSGLAAQIRLPEYTHEKLPNGIAVDVMPRRDVPLVTVQVVIRGGVESEPEAIAGIASVTAEALRRGTAKRSAEEFSQELDSLGASFSTGVNFQATSISSEFLAKDFEKGLDLLVDAITRPTFPADEIRKLLAQRIDAVRAMKDNPGAAADVYYRNFFFGSKHPYGQPADEMTLGRIDRDGIAGYHKRMYVGRNMIIVVAGDVEPRKASEAIAKAFGGVPSGQLYYWKTAPAVDPERTRAAIIDKPDATQTQILVGVPGVNRTHPDRVPLWLVNTLFGGRFTSILNDELRVNSGLTYGARSSFDLNRLPGRITMSTFTATENTGKALDMTLNLLQRLEEKGVTDEQLASAKSYLKGTYPADRLETPDQLADVLAEIELYDLTRGEVDDLFARIDAVTMEQANEVARKYYGQDKLTILLLGNAAKFASDVKKYDENPVTAPVTKPGFRVNQ